MPQNWKLHKLISETTISPYKTGLPQKRWHP